MKFLLYILAVYYFAAAPVTTFAEMVFFKTIDPSRNVMWASNPDNVRNERLLKYIKGYMLKQTDPPMDSGRYQMALLESLDAGTYRLDFGLQCSADFKVKAVGVHFDAPPRTWLVKQSVFLKKNTPQYFSMKFTISQKDANRKLRIPSARIGDLPTGADFTIFGAKLYKEIKVKRRKPELIFSASFDKGWKADFAKGAPLPVKAEFLDSAKGLSGNGVRITGKKAVLAYALDKNLFTDQGTVSFWYKPEWTKRKWNNLFTINRDCPGNKRNGSNWLWFWGHEGTLRADMSDDRDSYKRGSDIIPGQWQWLVFRWGPFGVECFKNGTKQYPDGKSPFKKSMKIMTFSNPGKFDRFFVGGNDKLDGRADGIIDDLKIYSGELSNDEISKQYQKFNFPKIKLFTRYFRNEEKNQHLRFRTPFKNSWSLKALNGREILFGQSKNGEVDVILPSLSAGSYSLTVNCKNIEQQEQLVIFSGKYNFSKKGNLDLEKVGEVKITKDMPSGRFVQTGGIDYGICQGVTYVETKNSPDARFAIKFQLPDGKTPYYIEWLYPDDKLRNADIVVHEAKRPDFGLCVGYSVGGEYQNSGKLLKQGGFVYPRLSDKPLNYALTMRAPHAVNAPGALAGIRIYRVRDGKLPAANLFDKRDIGLYYEDPAIYYTFSYLQSKTETMPGFEEFLARLSAYMKYSGQNMLIYPFVWYHGELGENYKARPHALNFYDGVMTWFDAQDLAFTGSINPHSSSKIDERVLTTENILNGSLHDTPVLIYNTGKPNPGKWHGSPPNFNILHPTIQQEVLDWVKELCLIGKDHPSFKGIELVITLHSMLSLGNLTTGYNDYMIAGFEHDTGIKVPVDRRAPLRGKLYAEWLLKNVKEKWIDWRCKKLGEFYCRVADLIASEKTNLKLRINTELSLPERNNPSTWSNPDIVVKNNREAGIDPKYFKDRKNIVLTLTTQPAIYRHQFKSLSKEWMAWRNALKNYDTRKKTFDVLNDVPRVAVHMHDKYWESPLGRKRPLKAAWFRETPWRVSTLNAGGKYAMRCYALPLRYHDFLQMSKGGFLVGSYGTEKQLASFAENFTVLPAVPFTDIGGDDIVKVRSLQKDGSTWFYVANTGDKYRMIRLSVPTGTVNASDGKISPELKNGILLLGMDPYSLRSFRCSGNVKRSINVIK